MSNFIRHAAVGLALSVSTTSLLEVTDAPHAEATSIYVCKDADGGSIGPEDFDIAKLQITVGANADGNFGPRTCEKTVEKMQEVGLVSADTTSVRIGTKTLIAFGLLPATESPSVPSAAPESAQCPQKVTSSGEISKQCRTLAKSLIDQAGYYSVQAYQAKNGIPFTQQTTKLGSKTYNLVMSGVNLNLTSPDLRQHVEVDVSDRIATYFNKGKAIVTARTSTGSGKTYTYVNKNGQTVTSKAVTPLGTFKVLEEKGADYKSGDLGGVSGSMAWAERLTWGGVFMHTGKITAEPASHGCVRIDGTGEGQDALKDMRDAGFGPGDFVIIHE